MAFPSIAHDPAVGVTVGVDTHGEIHVAAAFTSDLGRPLGHLEVPTTPTGYGRLLSWAQAFGDGPPRFGVEGTGAYGAGLARHLRRAGCTVIEVNRPNRQTRHARGKSDPVDAEAAARAVLSGEAASIPKSDGDRVGMIRTLRVARRSAVHSTTQIINQIHALLVTAPITTPTAATKMTLRALARRHQYLGEELATLNVELERLTQEVAPELCALKGVGPDVAGALLVAAGDNPERLRSEASFAHLCGVAPLPASSGKTTGRHRLNRGGNRQANNALWRIVIGRLRWHQPTKDYVARRTAEGLSKKEIVRCLKRYVAREVFRTLVAKTELARAA
jgi:transposase